MKSPKKKGLVLGSENPGAIDRLGKKNYMYGISKLKTI